MAGIPAAKDSLLAPAFDTTLFRVRDHDAIEHEHPYRCTLDMADDYYLYNIFEYQNYFKK